MPHRLQGAKSELDRPWHPFLRLAVGVVVWVMLALEAVFIVPGAANSAAPAVEPLVIELQQQTSTP
ncbi:MAG TPA: hypothetical protein VF642_08950 [Propionibacteriaceae bacterium]